MQTKQLLFGLVCYSITLSVYADTATTNGKSVYVASTNPTPVQPKQEEPEEDCTVENPSSFRLSMLHREANGIGYDQGYSSFDGFFAFTSIKNWHPFFDARVHFFNNWKVAANAGFGIRYQPDSIKAIFGINGFFDFRHTNDSVFEQAGVGVEALGTKWEARANGYFPIINNNHLYDVSFTKFSGHHALFAVKRELAFKGYDLSLGRTLFQRQYYTLSSTAGLYMFFADFDKTAKGGLLKVKSNISNYFSVEVQGSYDNLFKGILQGQAAINLPFGKKIKSRKKGLSCANRLALSQRLVEPVDRFEIIVTDHHNIQAPAKDPRTGGDLYIVFVDNTMSGGNGTAEAPFGTLQDAQNNSAAYQMIYVYGGSSTTTGMSSGITLQDGQWLQGSGRPFVVGTSFGLDKIPAQTTNWPTIGSTVGDTITLANHNILAGLNLIATNNTISGFNTENFTALHLNCAGSPLYDFSFNNPSGKILIANSKSLSKNGLYISTISNVALNLENNLFSNPGAHNMSLQFAGVSDSLVSMQLNTFQRCQTGSTIAAVNGAKLTLNIIENTFSDMSHTAAHGLQISASNFANLIAVLRENTLTAPTITGFNFSTANSAQSLLYIEDNTGTYTGSLATSYPFNFAVSSTATSGLLLQGNAANKNGYNLLNATPLSTFYVQSPTLSLEGLQSLNSGSFTTDLGLGSITYISYTPSSIPDLQ